MEVLEKRYAYFRKSLSINDNARDLKIVKFSKLLWWNCAIGFYLKHAIEAADKTTLFCDYYESC